MVNDNLLPKNIRQIGDIQSRRKICFEDYVMTYIRKMESREDENFLGVFLGERKKTQDTEYVFIRGILELPDPARPMPKSSRNEASVAEQEDRRTERKGSQAKQEDRRMERKGSQAKQEDRRTERKVSQAKQEDRRTGQKVSRAKQENSQTEQKVGQAKQGLWQAFQKRYGTPDEIMEPDAGAEVSGQPVLSAAKTEAAKMEAAKMEAAKMEAAKTEIAKTGAAKTEAAKTEAAQTEAAKTDTAGTEAGPSMPPSDPWERLRREAERSFPGCEIQGCCVIGTYPAGRIDELSAHFPEAGRILFHLQDQEERLYWLDGERYEGIGGYFVFYEQNQRMQEILEETFGEKSVEQEGLPDKAIRSFREKVRDKAEEQSHSFLKLASSFFVVGVLIVGVIVVNRVQDLQLSAGKKQAAVSQSETGQDEANVKQASQNKTDQDETGVNQVSQNEAEQDGADEKLASLNEANLSETSQIQNEAGPETLTEDNLQVMSDEILSGSDAFWADETELTDTADTLAASDATAASEMTASSNTAGALEGTAVSDTAAASEVTASSDTAAASDVMSTLNEAATTDADAILDATVAETDAISDATVSETDAISDATVSETEAISDVAVSDTDTTSETTTVSAATATSAVSRQLQASYVIREGDTLAGICVKYYGSLDRLEELCEANGIEDADLILPGQKIVLP